MGSGKEIGILQNGSEIFLQILFLFLASTKKTCDDVCPKKSGILILPWFPTSDGIFSQILHF